VRVASVQVGQVRTVTALGKTERTAIDKRPVPGGARLLLRGFEGDECADRRHHGTPDQAVLFFAASRYPEFEARLSRALPPGTFGENLTVEGTDEREVSIGDVWRVGLATVEVTSPRAPCGTLGRRLGEACLVAEIGAPHRAGWYARVLEEGLVRPGDAMTLVSRPDPAFSVERAAAVRADDGDVPGAEALLAVPGLAASLAERLARRVAGARR
jgi:MOSC domain-containing protein YiiM